MQNKSKRTLYKLAAAANQRIKEKDYWLNKLSGEYIKSRFPYDYHQRNVVESHHRLEVVEFVLSAELSSALIELSRGSDIRLYITLVTGLNALLYQYLAMDMDVLTIADIGTDIVIGMPILKSGTEVDFINTLLVLRIPVNPSMTFKELVIKTRQTVIEAVENRDYPIEILARDLNMPFSSAGDFPLLDVALLVENIHDRTYLNHVNLNMIFSFTRCESSIHGRLEYNPLLYRETTIEQIINHFKHLLREVVFNADIPLCKIEMISEEEKKRLLVDFNDTAAEYPQDKSIHELFAEQAERTPGHTAVIGLGRGVVPPAIKGAESVKQMQITYHQLNEKSNRLAQLLRSKGVGPDTIVGIMVERSIEMIIGIFGILKTGGAYLPIDPDYPRERINYMLKESNAKILLAAPAAQVKVEVKVKGNEEFIELIDISEISSSSTSTLTSTCQIGSANLAYIIYTSGTTGRPKGTLIEHRNVVRLMVNDKFQFDFNDRDVWTLFHSFCFDFSVWEMYGALLYGGKLVIITKMAARDTAVFLHMLKEEKVTVLNQTPSAFYRLVEEELREGDRRLNLRYVIFGGEALLPLKLREWNLKYPGIKLINMFGITETTVHVTYKEIGEREIESNISNIGKSIPTLSTYILDRGLKLVPPGVAGELCVGGEGLARGYLNRPQLTAERFIHLTLNTKHLTLYRSGDLVRFVRENNGEMEYLGRIDHQVKIRGFRIELGEIESRLLMHDKVKDAFVLSKEDAHGDKYLCAFCVPGDGKGAGMELRGYLSSTLPDYMVPSYFVFLEEIPLTPNGKVDCRALPEPEMEAGQMYAAPRDELDKKLVVIWAKVLDRQEHESIGIDDNFFELGGHSLRAAALISKIHKELNVYVPLSEIFTSPTIRGLTLYIKRSASDKYESVHPLEKKEYYRLSSAQKRLYFLQHMAPESTGYNMTFVLPVGKNIEKNKIESTLKKLIARHESLRTSFIMSEDEPVQRVHSAEDIEFEIEYYDLATESTEYTEDIEERKQKAKEIAQVQNLPTANCQLPIDFFRPFDLSQAPLIRSGLIKTREGNHIWMVDMHHIIADGTSMVILQEDFEALYSGEVLSELNIQYKDFSEWQNQLFESGMIKSQEDYWLNLYRDSAEIPRLDVPVDDRRPKVFTFAGDYYNFVLEREDAAKFKALAAKNNGTLYMNILAVLNTLFYNYTGQSDIIIGTGIAGRPHADLQGVIGMFVNTLAMRNYLQDEKPYESFLQEVIAHSVSAFENQDMQFEELVDRLQLERDTSRNPLFDMMMVVQNFRRLNRPLDVLSLSTPEKNLPVIDFTHTTSKFDMTFFVQEEGEDVYISIEYYTAIFKKETIARFAQHFKKIIREVVSNPFIRLAEIDMLTEQEREDVLYRFNATESVYPKDRAVCELFEEQVEQTPDAVALIGQGAGVQGTVPVPMDQVSITYKELNEKSNQLANFLYYEKYIRMEARLGILMDKSVERIMAVLGVLKAGGAYVPIDPSLPEERIGTMIDDAHIEVLISQKRYIRTLNRLQWECESFHTFLCMDSWDIYSEDEEEKSEWMDESLWKYVADTAVDDITAGGWVSSYTGKPYSKAEMDEYGDNILKKVTPLLHQKMRVLEIGCASGISMYRIAPRVGFYYGTDLSEAIILKNKKQVEQEGHQNIHLSCVPAHDIDKIEEKNFDLIIINSVVQCFPGHNYLRKILRKAIGLMKEQGYIFIGDVMDQELKADFIRDLETFKLANASKGKDYTTKTDFSSELFVSRGFFDDLSLEIPWIRSMEYSCKIGTFENELTRFRYDVLVTIDKTQAQRGTVKKYQQDLRALENQSTEKVETRIGPHHMAYVIYTSGTAGQPKGVIIQHGSLVNLCFWHNRYYQVTERDRATQYAGFGFDASVWEIFPYLVKGAVIHIISDDIRLDPGRINDFYESRGITIGFLPTQLCEQFMEESNHSLRVLLTGGDKLNRFTPQSYRLYNNYGPTENTVVTTAGPVEAYNDNIPIGKPIGNVQVYILNKNMLLLQPVGAAGELCITGASLARGYLNDPELTAEKFLYASYRSYRSYRTYSSKKIYKTGDLARWLADGNIEFLGRMDYQVKIRAYRIELGEIESRLIAHDDIKEAVVIDRGGEKGDSYLCAYIVPADPIPGGFDTAQLADHLAERLPDYMIPTYFVQLEKIPLTLSGKVDRKALPDPVGPAAGEYIAPRNRLEEKLVEIWSGVLGIDRNSVSIDSDFFRMGGHSLNATRLVARLNKGFNLKLPLTKVFEFSRLTDFADYLNGNLSEIEKGGQAAEEIELVEEKEYYDVSSSQKRLWILSQQEEASLTFNIPLAYSLEGQLDIDAFEKVFDLLTARHESLRTVFITKNGQPKQKIIPRGTAAFQIHSVDLAGEEPEPSKHLQVQQFIDSELRTRFDLAAGPLLRVKLLTLAQYRYVFLFTMHHIISDAISMQVLFREVFLLYNSMKKGGGNPLKSLKIQYKDYTAWQKNRLKGEQLEKLESYWFEQLSAPLPMLELPFDHPRPQVLTFNGAEFSFTVDEPLTRQLKAIGEQHDATLFMVLLTAFKGLLFRYGGQTDIVAGTVIAGREHADLYDQIGFYLNTLALRTRFNPEDSFAVLLKKVRHVCLEAYDHQLYSFDQLVSQLGIRRDVSRNPIFDVMVDMINTNTDAAVYGRPAAAANANPAKETDLIIQPLGFNEIKSKYDLTFYIFEGTSTLSFKFEYNRDLFENTTIRRMAKRLQALLKNIVKNPYSGISDLEVEDVPVFSSIKPVSPMVEAEAQLPASYHQERLWFIDQFEAGYIYPSSPVYHNIPLLLEINGALNIELLEQSIKEVIQRHQALRTRVITRDNRPFQSIRPSVDFHLEVKDVVQGSGDGLFETAVKLAVEETQRPFLPDQDQEPLIRGLLMQMEASCKFLLVITVHHIIADKYSLEILAREILLYYEAFLGNNSSPQLEDLSFQYGDFSQWQRAFSDDQIESLLFYWKWKLRGKLQALELPTDRPRAPIHIYQNGWHPFTFAETLNDKINAFIGHNNHLLLLAAFKTLLYHYSGQEEIVVGTGMRNRTQPGTEGIIGPIANLVVVRSFLTQGITFNELLSQLKKTVAEAQKYQAMPFDRLVLELKPDVDMSRTALFDVLFQYEEDPFQLPQVGNLKIDTIETSLGWGKYDLNMLIQRNGDRFSGVLVYNRDYHNESTISRFIGHFMVLLEEILAEPHRQISQFNLLTEEEQRQLLMEWNQPQIDYPTDKTIHEIFQEQAAGRPDGVAVIGQGAGSWEQGVGAQGTVPVPMDYVSITYKELNEKSNQLAYVLRQKGVATDTIVGMLMERSVEMIIAILGILKAGGAYLPIDPDYPRERIDYMLTDSGAAILLTNLTSSTLSLSSAPKALLNLSEGHHIDFPVSPLPRFLASQPSNLAYIIYTSGTTGQPKGCMITHKNVISILKNKIRPFDFNENDVWTMFHQYNFDFSVWEMYGALLYSGKLIVIPKMVTRDPGQYLEILKQEKVTVLNQTPSAFYQLSAAEASQSDSGMYIRYVIFGGEALNPAKLKQWKVKYPDTKLINMFGITETTIHVTYKEIGDKEIEGGTSNIGRPVSTLTAYIVGRNFNLLPIGVPGELCVGGEGLARGYLNRPQLTSEKFIHLTLNTKHLTLYRSGDLVKLLENGDMEYLGRIDHQVQIRGFRIELGEIENQLLAHQAVKEAVVICIEDDRDAGDKTLCACIVSDKVLDAVEMRDFLSRRLPGYMVPSLFKQVDHIPLTPNGKVDRKALRSSGTRLGAGTEYVPPATPTETRIAGIWREILKLDKNEVEIGIHDNFFDIGGTSMDVVLVNAKIAEEFGKKIPIVTMYKYTTIRALSGYLDRGEAEDQDMISEEKRADRIQKGRADKNKMRDKRKRGRR